MAGVEEFLKLRLESGLLRTLKPVTFRQAGKIMVGGREYFDFSSNDYLGLSGHPRLIEAAKRAMDELGSSSCASRLLSGDLQLHHLLEEKVAQFKNKEAALTFNSGYQANVGIISSLLGKDDCIFSDRLNHASIVDGIILSRAKCFRYQHNDINHLESLLEKERANFKKALIITETIFSMDGDRCHLKDLVSLKERFDCEIFIDEAHATGIFGKNGSGVAEDEGLEGEIDFIMGTFSKALGSFGAYVATSRKAVDYLVNTSRSFIYSTALPPAVIAANIASIDLIRDEPFRRGRLLESARYLLQSLAGKGFKVLGDSQIVPLVIEENNRTVEFAKRLQELGYWVLAIRPPTVPTGQARLRLSLTFHHTKEILEKFIDDICAIKI